MKKTLLIALSLCLCLTAFAKEEVPSEKELKKLALDSLLAFNDAIKQDDFTEFREQIATLWQKQVTAEQLKSAFAEFIEKKLDISGIKDLQPTLDPAQINSDDLLLLNGFYPTTPVKVRFKLKYIQEEGDWKLVSINVSTKD